MNGEAIIEEYVAFARGAGFPALDPAKHHDAIEAALASREEDFYNTEEVWGELLPFTKERGKKFVEALREYDLSQARPPDIQSPALEGKWYRARSYTLTCREGRFPRIYPPPPGETPEMVTVKEWWIEAASKQVVEYALEEGVLEEAVKALLALTPEPERRSARKSPPMPEETKGEALAFVRKYGPLGLLFRDIYAFTTRFLGSSPPRVEFRVTLGAQFQRTEPPSLPLKEHFGYHLRNPEAIYKEILVKPRLSLHDVQGLVINRRDLFREYREAVHEIYYAALDFKRACYTLQGLIEDPFGLELLERALSRCPLRLSREGGVRFVLKPRCLLDALYLHVAQGHALGGLEWRECRGCGRKFIPQGREKYCTQRCRSRTNVRKWRARKNPPPGREPGEGRRA
ncbi:MAG: hypothetical protein H5T73_11540 [Actinobacteria bacterium]|nr:hypothetical protein [Actinomycetota bacterium]